ncbi:hypothetical protein PRNP1_008130 [Phytophthora ramorum]
MSRVANVKRKATGSLQEFFAKKGVETRKRVPSKLGKPDAEVLAHWTTPSGSGGISYRCREHVQVLLLPPREQRSFKRKDHHGSGKRPTWSRAEVAAATFRARRRADGLVRGRLSESRRCTRMCIALVESRAGLLGEPPGRAERALRHVEQARLSEVYR